LGISRSRCYEYKKRFEQYGLDGLHNLPPIYRTHPRMTPPEAVDQFVSLSYEQPGWCCQKTRVQAEAAHAAR
jgi:hypothetical protein